MQHEMIAASLFPAQCDLSEGVWQLIQNVILSKPSPDQLPVMFLGGGCSSSIEPLAALTGRFYNATQVGFVGSYDVYILASVILMCVQMCVCLCVCVCVCVCVCWEIVQL